MGKINPPPEQTAPGVLIYHADHELDRRIREVRTLREGGYDVDTICEVVQRGRATIFAYLRQISLAQIAYMEAHPEEFEAGLLALRDAILKRQDLDAQLRRELVGLADDTNPSNKVGVYKLIMRNMRESEELRGLLLQRIEHSGEVAVKDQVKDLLENAPVEMREAYLDALSSLIAVAEHKATTSQPEPG